MFQQPGRIHLFKEKKIEDYLKEIQNNIKGEMNKIGESYLLELNVEQVTQNLIERHKVKLPKLEKTQTKTYISREKISGHDFPSGTSFELGRVYEIEIANFEVPVSGDIELLRCSPRTYSSRTFNLDLINKSLLFKFTNWGDITGNANAINQLKQEFLSSVESIESNINNLVPDIIAFEEQLPNKIKQYLNDRIMNYKSKKDSESNLNPFA